MDIKLVIFDFDGTILDTKKTIVVAKQVTMRQMGLPVADEVTCADTIGMSAKNGFQSIFPEMKDEMLDLCVQNYRRNFELTKEILPPTLFPDVAETLQTLKDRGVTCTIATSRSRKSLMEFLEQMNLKQCFSYLLAAEDTKLLKPDAEPVLRTLQDLSVPAEKAMVIGDMPVDILMGKRAGTYTCGVSYGIAGKERLLEAGADFVIDGIGELMNRI